MAEPVVIQSGGDSGNNGMGFILGIIALIVFAFLFIYYLLPVLKNQNSAPQINVPDKVDLNINQE
ncbi:MAG TPA: hypothetical protein PKH59_02070 [Candidatus Woesebacteria bacterium]|jgi:uncharacterized membrane protein|nr:hypothetical protein [Candidatus Woesebacteria bacterium]